jgi:hypothetical protein
LALASSATAQAEDPRETVCKAFRTSERNLVSGNGSGVYRSYSGVEGKDWVLTVDSDFSAHFNGGKYHLKFTYRHDRLFGTTSERIIFDGQVIRSARFSPLCHPTGAEGFIRTPETLGDGVFKPGVPPIFWDITKLANNVWNPEMLLHGPRAAELEFQITPEGDVIVSYDIPRAGGRDRVRFECPRRFGYNIGKKEEFNGNEPERPVRSAHLDWKQSSSGLWYVRSLDETYLGRDQDGSQFRERRVLIFSAFEPNAVVDPKLFTEESLELPDGTRIVDQQVGRKTSDRIYRKNR